MPKADHYAVLVTINRYPGLQDLQGPENDGLAFKQWLLDPEGGDLPSDNVAHIRSRDFEPIDNPYDANPTERQLVRALDQWVRAPDGWVDRVGSRLYLFFAGHGFTAGSSISDPALFTAVAQVGDTAHIAGYRYAAKIANAGFFDEIVLVMDCCQDVLKAGQVLEPTWSPPDRNRSSNVKLLQAYGAPRGRKAFERELEPGSPTRGLFSSVWTEALRSALADAEGWVTGQAVKNLLHQLWSSRFRSETGYDPPVLLPAGDDIRLYRRLVPSTDASAEVAVDLAQVKARWAELNEHAAADRGFADGGMALRFANPTFTSKHFLGKGARVEALRSGLYAIATPEGEPDLGFEVLPVSAEGLVLQPQPEPVAAGTDAATADQEVTLAAADAGAEILVFDAQYRQAGAALGSLTLTLPPGIYKAEVQAGSAVEQKLFSVAGEQVELELPAPAFESAAPVSGTATTHEYQSHPAAELARGAARAVDLPGPAGELFVFARDSHHELGAALPDPPWKSLRLAALMQSWEAPTFAAADTDTRGGFAGAKFAIPEGSYALLVEHPGSRPVAEELGLVVPVVAGWRTEVYLDCADVAEVGIADGDSPGIGRALDLFAGSMHLVPMGADSLLFDPLGHSTELARAQLALGRECIVPPPNAAARAPMWALYSAYSAWSQRTANRAAIGEYIAPVPLAVRRALPDFELLERWCSRTTDEATPTPGVPTLAATWKLAAKLGPAAGLHPQVGASISQWRMGGTVWTVWNMPESLSRPSRDALRTAFDGRLASQADDAADHPTEEAATQVPRLDPPWSMEVWVSLASALRTPNPMHSPFQQSLRRRILDAIADDEWPAQGVFELAAEFMLAPQHAVAAYRDLYVGALDDSGGGVQARLNEAHPFASEG